MTKITAPLRREIEIDGEPYTLTVSADGLRLTRKRFRSGRVMSWRMAWEKGDDELERDSGMEPAP